jgi:hypothetical protein
MAYEARDLQQYAGARVLVVVNKKDGTSTEVEGLVDTVSAVALLIKPKGRTNLVIVEVGEIEEITLAPQKEKPLKSKRLAPVKFGNARQHLLSGHAETLENVNSMTEEEAWNHHDKIDHVEDDLGHWHGDKDDEYPFEEPDDDDSESDDDE